MDDDLGNSGSESGGSLRQKLEEALAANKDLASRLTVYEARDVIGAQGFKYVTPEDLAGVPSAELAEKAAQIEEQKRTEREAVLREVLSEKGLPDDQLDQALAALVGQKPDSEQAHTDSVLNGLSRIQGAPTGKLPDNEVFGPSRLQAAFADVT